MTGDQPHIIFRIFIVSVAMGFWGWGFWEFLKIVVRWGVRVFLVAFFVLMPVSLDRWIPPAYGSITQHVESKMYSEHFLKMRLHGYYTIVLCENGQEFFWRKGQRCRF